MIRTLLCSFFCIGLTVSAAAGATVPRPSPEFAIQMNPSGQTLLSQYRGKVVLLAFLSTT